MNLTATVTYNTFYRLANIIIVYVTIILLSKMAGVAGYGLLSLMVVNATFFNMVSSFGADSGITYHTANEAIHKGKITTIIFIILLAQIVIISITELLSYNIMGHFQLFKTGFAIYWWIGCLFLLSISLTEKYTALFSGHYMFSVCNAAVMITNLLILLVFFLLFKFFREQNVIFLAGVYVALSFFQSLVLMTIFHSRVKGFFYFERVNRPEVKAFLSFSGIVFLSNVIQFLAYRADYWFMDYFKGGEELGWYSLASRLVQIFWILPVLFAGIIFPQVANEKEKYKEYKMLSFIRILFVANFAGGMMSFFLAQWIIPGMFGEAFSKSILPFQILLPGVILFCPTTILAAYFAGKGQLRVNLFGSAICFFFVIMSDLMLIPSYGMNGAAVASSIGYIITSIYFISVYSRQTKTPLSELFHLQRADWNDFRAVLYKINLKRNR
ncbi:MAG: polysaccharide biosynthesis C-terminal domain-containing protein [Chitinophagaceae bacterium]